MIDSTFLPTTSASDVSPAAKARAAGDGDRGETFGSALAAAVQGGQHGAAASQARQRSEDGDQVAADAGGRGHAHGSAGSPDDVAAAEDATVVDAEADTSPVDPAAFAAALHQVVTRRRAGHADSPALGAASPTALAHATAVALAHAPALQTEPLTPAVASDGTAQIDLQEDAILVAAAVDLAVPVGATETGGAATDAAAEVAAPDAAAAADTPAAQITPAAGLASDLEAVDATQDTFAAPPATGQHAAQGSEPPEAAHGASQVPPTTPPPARDHGTAATRATPAAPASPARPAADVPAVPATPATPATPAAPEARPDAPAVAVEGANRGTPHTVGAAPPQTGGEPTARSTATTPSSPDNASSQAPVAVGQSGPPAAGAVRADAAPTQVNLPAMVHRIAQVVETLRNAPPPRSVSLEFPELDGLRLQVSLRGGTVHVVASGGQEALAAVEGMTRDLGTALQQRGFDLGSFQDGREAAQRRADAEARRDGRSPNGSAGAPATAEQQNATRPRRPEAAGLRL